MTNWLYTYDGKTERVQVGGTELVDGDAVHVIGSLRIHTLDGNVVAIDIQPDEVEDEEPVEDDEDEEEAVQELPAVAAPRIPAGKKVIKCSQCGQSGHNARRCEGTFGRPAAPEDPELTEEQPKKERVKKYDHDALRHDILNGMAVADIAEKHGVTAGTVYTERWVMKNEGEQVPGAPKGREKPADLTDDQIEEIKQRRGDGETTSEIAAVMELDSEEVAKVMADGRRRKSDRRAKDADSFDDKVARLVAQGCSVGDIKFAFPSASERAIEEAIAWAQR